MIAPTGLARGLSLEFPTPTPIIRIDINTIPPDIAHNNNFNFDIGRSSIHNNNSLPGANNKQYIESAPV
jgi:hypothetical protein